MKHILRLFLAGLVTFLFSSPTAQADVNDFSFESFDAQYEISLNEEQDNRPEMIVTETIVALFPDFDQNRGIRRDIPASSYGELPGLVKIISVTDGFGMPREYEESRDGNFVSLAIKASDGSFVYGKQTYVIKYSQAWVIKDYKRSSGFDEFYWDINGTGWQQSFGRVSASVSLDSKLKAALVNSNIYCYQGLSGSDTPCESKQVVGDQLTFSSSGLQAGENLSIAVAFKHGVANTKGPEVAGTVAMNLFWVALALVVVVLFWAIYFRFFVIRRQGRKSFIVPIYQPTKEPGLLTSALVTGKMTHLIQALIIERAVHGELELQPGSKKKDFILRRSAAAKDPTGLLAVLGLAKAGDHILVGPSAKDRDLKQIAQSVEEFISAERKAISKSGYFIKRALGLPAAVFGISIAIFIAWLVSGVMLDSVTDAGFVAAPLISFSPFAIVYWILVSKRAFSAKGGEVAATVSGLEMYIELAEKDRLEFLQSPEGALLKPSELRGKKVLKLYEEVLPWAILLGLQEQWGKVLTDLYAQGSTPLWFVATPNFSDSLNSLDSALASSLASSSTGGSSGGGSSGGGGGGGGGGGI